MKTLYIIRGLPGSGKSTIARLLAPKSNVANDDYFTDPEGNYSFDPSKKRDALNYCKDKVEFFMEREYDIIAVHNTFVLVEHMNDYIKLCGEYGYTFNVIECKCDFGNVHSVPQNVLERMRDGFEPYTYTK